MSVTEAVFSEPEIMVKSLGKGKFNGFLGGLIIGALFSLVVNIITVSIQENVTRQIYLESLEREIVTHSSQSQIKEDEEIGKYFFTTRYDSSVWKSGNAEGYIYELDSSVQRKIEEYYPATVFPANRMLDNAEEAINRLEEEHARCVLQGKSDCKNLERASDGSLEHYNRLRLSANKLVNEASLELLNEFHPMEDRLDSFFLKLFMGD